MVVESKCQPQCGSEVLKEVKQGLYFPIITFIPFLHGIQQSRIVATWHCTNYIQVVGGAPYL